MPIERFGTDDGGRGASRTLAREAGPTTFAGTGSSWSDAVLGVALILADRPGIRSTRLVAGAGPVRDEWMTALRRHADGPLIDVPAGADAEALHGGLDVEATLTAGRPVRAAGLIERARGGILVLRDAERLPREAASAICAALDGGETRVVALDGSEPDESLPAPLLDRCAVTLDLRGLSWRDALPLPMRALTNERVEDEVARALDAAALSLPGRSLRRSVQLVALAGAVPGTGRERMAHAIALNLGLDTLAMTDPQPAPEPPEAANDDHPPPSDGGDDDAQGHDGAGPSDRRAGTGADGQAKDPSASDDTEPGTVPPEAVAALLASLPAGLLDGDASGGGGGEGRRAAGVAEGERGRPAGTRRVAPHAGARPAILPTLRAAVPWQRARGRKAGDPIAVRPSDLRYARRVRPAGTTVVFAVDASGSAARERLAEAKGAVEALLAEAYVRRDKVALVAFRDGRADVLLPPTRGLVTAKRALGSVPGGGATPLAAGLLRAAEVCRAARAGGERALMVVLTDGRGNVALDGRTGRTASRDDEDAAAMAIRRAGIETILIDTAARPGRHAPALAERLGATSLAMPRARGADWAAAVSHHLAPPRAAS